MGHEFSYNTWLRWVLVYATQKDVDESVSEWQLLQHRMAQPSRQASPRGDSRATWSLIRDCKYRREASVISDPNWSLEKHPYKKPVSVPPKTCWWEKSFTRLLKSLLWSKLLQPLWFSLGQVHMSKYTMLHPWVENMGKCTSFDRSGRKERYDFYKRKGF